MAIITTINEFLSEKHNKTLEQQLIDLVNSSKNFQEFEKIVVYYGISETRLVNVNDLINTEKVSGRPIVSIGPIRVAEDIKTHKITQRHHRYSG